MRTFAKEYDILININIYTNEQNAILRRCTFCSHPGR